MNKMKKTLALLSLVMTVLAIGGSSNIVKPSRIGDNYPPVIWKDRP